MTIQKTNGEGLPNGWVLVELPEVLKINPPKPTPDALAADLPVTFVPMPAVDAESGTISTPSTRPFSEVRKGFTAFRVNDVIMAKITPCMENGKAAIARNLVNGLGFGSTEFHVLRASDAVLPEYVYHFIRQESFRRSAEQEMTGSVGQKRVPADFLVRTEVPLPPLAEQKRIVAKVETLLARVNAARQRLAKVPALLKRFRQSILAAACSGRLTEDWRDENTVEDPDQSWESTEASEICELVQSGTTPRDRAVLTSGVPFLKVYNIVDQRVAFKEKPQFISEETHTGGSRRAISKPGDVIMNIVGPPLGKVAVIPDDYPEWSVNQAIAVFRAGPRLDRQFLFHLLCSGLPYEGVLRETRGSAGQSNISLSQCRNMIFRVPPLAEQHEIVRRVEALLARADRIEKRLAAATRRVESLTQAILAQAFRGELVPTEAELARQEGRDYEPASVLLDRIRRKPAADGAPVVKRRGRRQAN